MYIYHVPTQEAQNLSPSSIISVTSPSTTLSGYQVQSYEKLTPTQLSRLLCTQFPNLRPGTTPLRHKYLGKSRDVGITDLILRNTSPSILARIYEKNRHHATHLRSSRSYSRWAGLGGLWYRYFQWTATWLWTGR